MLLLGLTGSIATGKSTVSAILSSPPYSLPIIDADKIARQVVEPGTPGYRAIIAYFSPLVPDLLLPASDSLNNGREDGPQGKGRYLNRPALGRAVFGEGKDEHRKKLGSITHPEIGKAFLKAIAYYWMVGHWAVVLDVPLLFESKWEARCGSILVVAVSEPETQMKRLLARDEHLSEEDARNRVAAQVDVRDKAKRAKARGEGWGAVVWNDGSKEELEIQIRQAMAEIQKTSPGWWARLCWLCPPVGLAAAGLTYLRSGQMAKAWERERTMEKARL